MYKQTLCKIIKPINTANCEIGLELFSSEHKNLSKDHIIEVYPLSESMSWEEGTQRYDANPPSTTTGSFQAANGATWIYRNESTGSAWPTGSGVGGGQYPAWVDGTDAAVLSDSFNISSGTDNGTGDYTYAFSNSLSRVNYSMPMGGLYAALQGTFAQATGSCRLKSFGRADSLTAEDEVNFFAIFGDLA